MELLEILRKRRSIRKYTNDPIPAEALEKILQAGLLAPSSRGIYPVELIAVRDRETLQKLSHSKLAGAAMLRGADTAIVVAGDTDKSDAWIEDAAITMTLMMTEATALGIGSCWVQCRNRKTALGADSEKHVRKLLNIPERFGVLSILSLGLPDEAPEARSLPDAKSAMVHYESF